MNAEIAPNGVLRVAIVVTAVPSPIFAGRAAGGKPEGVAVDLAHALAARTGLPHQMLLYPNSGEITDAGRAGRWDVAFMPKDAERAALFDFSPPYFIARSTYLVPSNSPVKCIEDVNRSGIRVVAIQQTTTARSVRRTAPDATLIEVPTVDEFVARAKMSQADAFALSHDVLTAIALLVPGSHILEGQFQAVGVCAAVPKGRSSALALVSTFIDEAKTSGIVRAAFDRAGFTNAEVAP